MQTLIRLLEQSDLCLHCLPRPACPKTYDHYGICDISPFRQSWIKKLPFKCNIIAIIKRSRKWSLRQLDCYWDSTSGQLDCYWDSTSRPLDCYWDSISGAIRLLLRFYIMAMRLLLRFYIKLVVLRLNVPVNNFSVMSGRSHRFLGN